MSITYPGSLHNHTQFSNLRLRDCIIKENLLIDYAIELGHKVVAITDHETISSWVKVEKYYNKIKKDHPDFKVIRGNEIYLCRDGLNAENFNKEVDRYYHFILLAKDRIGAKQIMEISTRAWHRSYMAKGMRRVPTYYQDLIDIIGADPGHVILSTACLGGALPTQILRGTSEDKLIRWIEQMQLLAGKENFYLEMQPSNNKEQFIVNKKLLQLSKLTGAKYIITTDSHYLKKEDRKIHKAYLNAQNGDREVDDFYATTYMMSDEELRSFFPYFSKEEVEEGYKAIEKIAEMCEDFSLQKSLYIPNLKWKQHSHNVNLNDWYIKIPLFKTFMESEYFGDRELVYAIIDGINHKEDLQNDKAYAEINSNLDMIWTSSEVNKAHWSAYLLNLQNIIDLCWLANSIVGPGRGSGVGFLLLYVLDITQINPLREATKTFAWRFLNPVRVSPLDVDFDIEGTRRADVLKTFRKYYGEDRVSNVATFRAEKSKSAILTAARGLGIDVDIAQYIAGLVPADRGQIRTLTQCFYGDEENDWPPVKQFVYEMTNNYPELWEVAQRIEGLICGMGIHAGGVIFVDEPFTESTALMRAPDGTIITQFDLHDAEAVSLIKYDALSVEAMDKIHNCLDLLCDAGYIERKDTLKETYESILNIYRIERTDPKMWELVWEHRIPSLFQMEQQSGIQGIERLKPSTVDELAILNSTIRLMAQEKGGEMPTDKLARFKADPTQWDKEMAEYGLGPEYKEILAPVLNISYGLCIGQEQFMELVQLPELGGFSLTWADRLRKSIAKKNPKEYNQLTEEFFTTAKEKNINQAFANYVWNCLIAMSRGYGFNQSHTLAYSLVALQEMNLAYKYPPVFWNCACLINDSGGNGDEIEEESEESPSCLEEEYSNNFEDFYEDEDEEDDSDEDEEVSIKTEKKKKKTKVTNYGKISTAIGKMRMEGIEVAPPDINYSTYTFSPDAEHNIIRYGLSGITRIGEDIIKTIIANRPYSSLADFISKVKLTKPQMVNLIKSGAFDSVCKDREQAMREYIDSIADKKKRLTLQNAQMLIDHNLFPDEYSFEIRVYNFNKFLKKYCKTGENYGLVDYPLSFYQEYFDTDLLSYSEDGVSALINQKDWDKIYKKKMDTLRAYIKENSEELLTTLNNQIVDELWNKYCSGNISKWEMDSVSFYSHPHELTGFKDHYYGVVDFFQLPEEPEVERTFTTKDGRVIPMFKLVKIAGTVLDKNKAKKTIELLTKTGVVTVKIYGVFSEYDRQLSIKDPTTGKKKVIEKSMFTRGNKLIITGIRQDDSFIAKMYKNTPGHRIVQIEKINPDGTAEIKEERAQIE